MLNRYFFLVAISAFCTIYCYLSFPPRPVGVDPVIFGQLLRLKFWRLLYYEKSHIRSPQPKQIFASRQGQQHSMQGKGDLQSWRLVLGCGPDRYGSFSVVAALGRMMQLESTDPSCLLPPQEEQGAVKGCCVLSSRATLAGGATLSPHKA